MTIAELIKILQSHPQEEEVYIDVDSDPVEIKYVGYAVYGEEEGDTKFVISHIIEEN